MAARSTPDRKVGGSIPSGVSVHFGPSLQSKILLFACPGPSPVPPLSRGDSAGLRVWSAQSQLSASSSSFPDPDCNRGWAASQARFQISDVCLCSNSGVWFCVQIYSFSGVYLCSNIFIDDN